MAITAYTSLLPYLVKDLPDCPTDIMLQVLQQKTRQFCIDTEGLVDRNRKFDLVADQKIYTISASQAYYEIARAVEIRINTAAGIASGQYGSPQNPLNFAFWRPTTIEFYNAPANYALVNGLEIDLVLHPLKDTTSMDFDFVSLWNEAIIGGTLAELKGMPGRAWSDPAGVAEQDYKWVKGVANCRRELHTHKGPRGLKMRPPQWA